jgi:hypothetical protein
MPELKSGSLRLYAIYRTDTPPGPAGSWLIPGSRLRQRARPKPLISARSLPYPAIDEDIVRREVSGSAVRSVAYFSAAGGPAHHRWPILSVLRNPTQCGR